METRKKILDLYEFNEQEREMAKRQKQEKLMEFMEEGDDQLQNKTFVNLKCRLRKAYDDLAEQEHLLEQAKEKLTDALGADGFFIN